MSPHTSTTVTADQFNAISDKEVKVMENRLRRAAARQGYGLRKTRTRDPRAVDFGVYYLVDQNDVIASEHASLFDVQVARLGQ